MVSGTRLQSVVLTVRNLFVSFCTNIEYCLLLLVSFDNNFESFYSSGLLQCVRETCRVDEMLCAICEKWVAGTSDGTVPCLVQNSRLTGLPDCRLTGKNSELF